MRRSRKNILGLLGLFLVVAVTFFAANLPNPRAKAATSVTDTIIVRVVGESPDVNILEPENGKIIIDPNSNIKLDFANVNNVKVELTYTDLNGNTRTETLKTMDPEGAIGDDNIPLNLDSYGYGNFEIKVTGTGIDGVKDIETIRFSYVSIYTDVEEDPETGLSYLNLHYLDDVVGNLDVNIYLGDKLIAPPSPIRVSSPTHRIELPFAGLATGTYTIKTTAYSRATGEKIGNDANDVYHHESTPVPDTGGFFKSGNISREDFLITGLIAFIAFGGIAIWIVAKGRKNNRRRK